MKTHLIEYDPRTLEVWRATILLIDEQGKSPTISEIGDACGGIPYSKVQYHLQKLVRAGCVKRKPNTHRSLKVVQRPDNTYLELYPLNKSPKETKKTKLPTVETDAERVYEGIYDHFLREKTLPTRAQLAESLKLSMSRLSICIALLRRTERIHTTTFLPTDYCHRWKEMPAFADKAAQAV